MDVGEGGTLAQQARRKIHGNHTGMGACCCCVVCVVPAACAHPAPPRRRDRPSDARPPAPPARTARAASPQISRGIFSVAGGSRAPAAERGSAFFLPIWQAYPLAQNGAVTMMDINSQPEVLVDVESAAEKEGAAPAGSAGSAESPASPPRDRGDVRRVLDEGSQATSDILYLFENLSDVPTPASIILTAVDVPASSPAAAAGAWRLAAT